MKKLFTAICLMLSALVLVPEKSKASHMAGAEISYTYQGTPNSYLLRLKFYRDCAGIAPPLPQSMCVSSASTPFAISLQLNLVSQTVIPNPPCVSIPAANCSFSGGGGQGTEEYIFEVLYTLPNAATDWVFSWSDCCRNGAITTLQPNGMYVSATLNNITHPTDNSAIFNFIPYTTFCVGYPFYYDQGATDPDGDSLVFSLAEAEEGGFCNPPGQPSPATALTYINPYTYTQPVASSVPITMNPNLGVIYFIPSLQQVAVICVLVKAFDKVTGALIGTVKRDIQVVITTQCNIVNPAFSLTDNSIDIGDPTGTIAGPYNCGDTQFILPFAEKVQCGSLVSTDVRVLRPSLQPNPVVSVQSFNGCPDGKTDSVLVTVLYPLTSGKTIVVIKTGVDGNSLLSQCGSAMQPFRDTANIYINDLTPWVPASDSLGCLFNQKTVTFNENIFCFTLASDGSDLILRDAVGTTFPFSSSYGYCDPNGEQSNQMLMTFPGQQSAVGPVYLIVKTGNDGNTIASECGRFLNVGDTLAVFYINNDIDVNLGSDLDICDADPFPVLNSGFTGLAYQWAYGGVPNPADTNATYTANQGSGDYSVFLSSSPTCNGSDTINIEVNITPTVIVNDIDACSGTTITLDAGSAGLGYNYQWYFNGNGLNGDTLQTYSPNQTGNYTAFVANGNCFATDDAFVNIYPTPTVILANQTICSNVPLPQLSAGSYPNTIYQWFDAGAQIPGANDSIYQTTAPGTYSVIAITGGICSDSAGMTLAVVTMPVTQLPADLTKCVLDQYPIYDAGTTLGFPSSYVWSLGGVPIAGAINQFYTPVQQGSYIVVVDNGNGCTATDTVNITDIPVYIAPNLANESVCVNATATVLDAGNTGATYQWSLNGNVINGANAQTYAPSTSTSGVYAYTVLIDTTNSNCKATGGMTLTVVDYPVVSVSDQRVCADVATYPTFAGGTTNNATYLWTDQNAVTVGTDSTYTPSGPLAAGTYTYTVVVTVGSGCSATDPGVLTIDALPNVDILEDSLRICESATATFEALPAGLATYSWSSGQNTAIISNITTPATYYVTGTDGNGCSNRDSVVLNVDRILEAPVVICAGGSSSSSFKFVYTWSAIDNAMDYEVNEGGGWIPAVNVGSILTSHGTNNVVANFIVRAVNINLAGVCREGRESLPSACAVTVPNIITPNGDGKNDALTIPNIEQYPNNHFTILNRWGKEVYSRGPYSNLNNEFRGADLPDGVYFYILELGDGSTAPLTGTVTISRGDK